MGQELLLELLMGLILTTGFAGGTSGKESICQRGRHERHGLNPWVSKTPLEEEMTTHSTILVWKIPEEKMKVLDFF